MGLTAGCRAIDPTEAPYQGFLYTMSNIEPARYRICQQEHSRNLRDRSQAIFDSGFPTGARIAGTSIRQRSDMQQVWPARAGQREAGVRGVYTVIAAGRLVR